METRAYRNDAPKRDELVLEQLPQVHVVARKMHCRLPAHILLEDLVHAGIIGLLDALDKFNPAKNVRLKAYAEFRIRGAILDSLREGDWSPRALRRDARRLEKALSQCEARLGRVPSESEIAAELGISLHDFQRLVRDLDGLAIEDFQEVTGGGDVSYSKHMAHENDPFTQTARTEMNALLMNAINELSDRERQVLTLYHFKELPMKTVGSALGIGESRVSQIHSAALVRLREQLAEAMGPARPQRNC